tara:strand:+ start:1964 stop:2263 length:300 start_codon:yes stop_codon:yes gene_type:complete
MNENEKNSGFSVSLRENTAGFRLFFENGYGISVIFGGDSGSKEMKTMEMKNRKEYFCDNAEVAVLNPKGELVPFMNEGAVKSFCTPEEFPKIISWTMNK